jgi:mannose-6-phosphate isomerase-like protein (cupin superfamily)
MNSILVRSQGIGELCLHVNGGIEMLNLLFLLMFFGLARPAPAGANSGGAVVTSVQMNETMKSAKPLAGGVPGTYDETVRSLDAGNSYVAVAVIRRVQAEDHDALVHEKVTEMYYITEGSGTMELGGTLVGGKPFGPETGIPAIGPSMRGTGIQGGHTERVSVGDVVMIPAGTPHRFSAIDGPIRYVCFRLDPSKSTPLK